MTDRFLITGMFRSGTTLFARMLDSHPDIACASDPFRPFFNCFRDEVAEDIGVPTSPYDPLGSYFADADQHRLFEAVQNSSFDRPFPIDESQRLLERIQERGEPFSPRIIKRLDELAGDRFVDVYDNLLNHVQPAYGTGEEHLLGTKETWSTEMVPALARPFPKMKFLLLVRDPRAVTASKNVNDDSKYPWLFLIRQWRKLATLAWHYDTAAPFADRVHMLTFEELVTSPEQTATSVCDFLDVEMGDRILDLTNYTDGEGNQWLQNTSYDDPDTSFDADAVDRWEEVHDQRTTSYIESLCYPEMELLDYETQEVDTSTLPDRFLISPPTVSLDEMADWIQPYYEDRTSMSHQNDIALEQVRHALLRADREELTHVDDSVIAAYFLLQSHFEALRDRVLQ